MSEKVSQVTSFQFGIGENDKPQAICTANFMIPAIKKFTVVATLYGDVPRLALFANSLILTVMESASWLAKGNRLEHPRDEVNLEVTSMAGESDATPGWDFTPLSDEQIARLDLVERIDVHSFHRPDDVKNYELVDVFVKVWINGLAYRGYGHAGQTYFEQINEALLTALDSRRVEDGNS